MFCLLIFLYFSLKTAIDNILTPLRHTLSQLTKYQNKLLDSNDYLCFECMNLYE